MGLLSKIFNTNKLAYILREEEEFSVAAPKQWNVETLTVGDTITPDMFKDNYRFYDFDLYIKEIGWDDEYEHDDIEGSWYVTTKFDDSEGEKKYGHNQFVWWLHELNDFLKPQYQVFQPLFESKEDEFNVDAPQNWNVEYLSIGDQITPDMWNQKSKLIWDLLDTDINKTYKIIGFFEEWDGYEEQEDFDPIFVELEDEVGHISTESLTVLQGSLNPEFKITQNKNLNEVEDEFNVAAPPEWNVEELGVGDLITPENSTTGNYYLIKRIVGDSVYVRKGTLDYNGEFMPQHSIDFHAGLRNLQSRLKPGFTITQNKNLNEVEDEFNVDAPEDWNVIELGVGDQITPDMWQSKQYDLNIQGKTAEITDIGVDDKGPYVVLAHNNPYWSLDYDIDVINDLLKPQYKIEQNLIESDEDFNVDAPAEWSIHYLGVGDTIKGKMWNWKNIIKWCNRVAGDNHVELNELIKRWEDIYDEGVTIDKIVKYGDNYHVEFDSNSAFLRFGPSVSSVNKWLSDGYEIEPSLTESNDNEDFNVDAPAEWDITELKKGDYIMPDMWVKDIDDFFNFFTGQSESKYLFKQLTSKPIKITGVMRGDELYFEVAGLYFILTNDFLLPQYKVVGDFGMYESNEDDFNVDAPAKWNVTDLEIGDYIYPDMINVPRDKRKWEYYHNMLADPKRTYGWQITGFKKHDGRDLVRLEYNGVGNFFDVDLINNTLKQYRIFPPTNETKLSSLLEIDDEFTVEAPPEWDNYLTIGDTVTPDMWDDEARSLKNFKDFNTVLNNSLIIKNLYPQKIGGDPGYLIVFNDHTSIHSSFLDPKYIIDPPLNESDDEFSVDAPLEWNQESLSTGDIITPDMWDKQKFFDDPTINSIKVYNEAIEDSWIIESINYEEIDNAWFVNLKSSTTDHKYFGLWSEPEELNNINNVLKDNYKIYPPNTLLESDDEEDFSVDAPENWNITELGIGDILDSSNLKMQDPMKKFEIVDFKVSLFPWETNKAVLKVFQLKDEPIPGTNRTTKQWKYIRNIFVELKILNDRLKDNFKIIPSLRENEEEDFSVDAPQEWNVEYLTTGDTITPDMWDQSKIGRRKDFFSKPIKIDSIGYNEFDNEEEEPLVGLDLGDTTTEYDIDFVNYLLKHEFKVVQNKNLTEEEDFNVDAPAEWNQHELKVGDYFNDIEGKVYTHKKDLPKDSRGLTYEIVYIGPNEGEYHRSAYYDHNIIAFKRTGSDNVYSFTVEHFNRTRGPKLNAYINLPDRFNLNEDEEDFNVDALPEWDIIELKVGDYINSNMLNPKGNDYTWFSRRKLFIEDIYFDECWTVNLLHVESGYHTPFCIDYINEDVLNDKYRIMTSLNELLEIDDEFDVEAPQKWDVIELGVGDKITKDMIKSPGFIHQIGENFQMDFPGVITKIYKSGPIDDDQYWGIRIKFKNKGWKKYLPQSEDVKLGLGLSLDDFNEDVLKPQYQIQKPVFELSTLLENEEDFNVNAPDEWNVELLTVGDTVTPEMWGYEQINSWFDISKPLNIEDIGEDDGGWWVQLGRNEAPFDLDEVNEFLKPQYKIVPYNLEESDDEFSVNAPEEWNYDYWEPTKGMREDEYYESFDEFVTHILKKYGVEDEFIEVYLDEIFNFGDFTSYEGISSGDLYKDFQQWIKAQDETSEWYDDMNEEEDFSVDAPEEWWEYDGNIEITFQDTYWYEDENGKEAIVERDGGGIININDLEQYSYSGWKPFTGNPTNENLTKWYSSIDWDTDLIEMFDFDDSLFEVEEDFDWSTAENVDMERTGFRIRAVSTLKEVDDEFTVKAPKKWDIVYLNKGDFLDNTNSTFNDPNVKYEIGNITSDGEIEVKKYINRGNGFEPQFDRFMKTRKGIVKAKLKPGFDIEAFSK